MQGPSIVPTISLVSPKGGVGKTTAAVVLATQIAQKDKAVARTIGVILVDLGFLDDGQLDSIEEEARQTDNPVERIAKFAALTSTSGRMNARINIGARIRQSVTVSAISRRVIVRIVLTLIGESPRGVHC